MILIGVRFLSVVFTSSCLRFHFVQERVDTGTLFVGGFSKFRKDSVIGVQFFVLRPLFSGEILSHLLEIGERDSPNGGVFVRCRIIYSTNEIELGMLFEELKYMFVVRSAVSDVVDEQQYELAFARL